jgi:Skp family chaperone for outer membrane proteins
MNRYHILAAGLIAALGMVFVSGAAGPLAADKPENKPADEKKAPPPRPVVLGHKTGYFNMAAVMRDFDQAKYHVYLLNKKKDEISKNLVAWRGEYIQFQKELRTRPDHPQKDQIGQQMLGLARKIEDEDRRLSKQLNDDASVIIADLYDKMKAVVDKTAELNGYQAVLAYPDAVTSEERNSAYIKELKLKPPAAQPFYIDPNVDVTAVVIKTLNTWYPPLDPETGKPVDVSKLVVPAPVPAPQPQPQPQGLRPGAPPFSFPMPR